MRSMDRCKYRAHPQAAQAVCPGCGAESVRVHSRYERRLADAALAGRRLEIQLQVRRFFCDRTGCTVRPFCRTDHRADPALCATQPAAAGHVGIDRVGPGG